MHFFTMTLAHTSTYVTESKFYEASLSLFLGRYFDVDFILL